MNWLDLTTKIRVTSSHSQPVKLTAQAIFLQLNHTQHKHLTKFLDYCLCSIFVLVFLERDVGISIGAVVLVTAFIISSFLIHRLVRRSRRVKQPVIQVLQLDEVAREYLDNIGMMLCKTIYYLPILIDAPVSY